MSAVVRDERAHTCSILPLSTGSESTIACVRFERTRQAVNAADVDRMCALVYSISIECAVCVCACEFIYTYECARHIVHARRAAQTRAHNCVRTATAAVAKRQSAEPSASHSRRQWQMQNVAAAQQNMRIEFTRE